MGFGNTDTTTAKTIWTILRRLFAAFDRPVYGLLTLIYRLFFNVASSEIISGKMVAKFYGRIQLIIGVFMMFQLAMIIIKGIMNPDNFTDKKAGAGNVITRIMISLFMLTLIVPINIPNPQNEYEKKISNNGLLFGTLYSLQYRILNNNTIAKLILGVKSDNKNYSKGNDEDLEKSANRFASQVLRVFYRVNVIPESAMTGNLAYCKDLDDPAAKQNCRICNDSDSGEYIKVYRTDDVNPQDIITMVDETCNNQWYKRTGRTIAKIGDALTFNIFDFTGMEDDEDKAHYVFVFTPFLSTVVGIAMIFIFISFTIDVAVRAVKLAVLRLIAPIPIISYMDPNGSKDSAFNAWVKTLTQTYLSLFLRLAIVYFILFIIEGMMENGIVMNNSSGVLGGFTAICIFIGLFAFAKQAPKFFREALGVKDTGGKFFSGFEEIGTALGMAAAVPGAIGSARASARASRMADATRQSFGETDIFGRTVDPNRLGNRAKHLVAGIAGGVAGSAKGLQAAYTAKEHGFRSSMEAMRSRNADVLTRGDSGSTLGGRLTSTVSQLFAGEGLGAQTKRDIANLESRQKALDAIKSRVSGEMVKKDWTYGSARNGHVDLSNNSLDGVLFNYKAFTSEMEKSKSSGLSYVDVRDSNGHTHRIDYAVAYRMQGQILQTNEDNYVKLAQQEVFRDASGVEWTDQQDTVLVGDIRDAMAKGGSGWDPATKTFDRNRHNDIRSRDDYTKSSDGLGQDILEFKRQNAIGEANDSYAGKKK